MSPFLEVINFEIKYDNLSIGPVSFSMERGSIVHLQGPNGCGKSTLLRWLAGYGPGMGKVKPFRPKMAYLPQHPSQFLVPWLSLEEHVSAFGSKPVDEHGQSLRRALCGFGWPEQKDLAKTTPAQLSVGLRQLFALAFVLTTREAELLLLDEPFSALDEQRRKAAMESIEQRALKSNASFLVASHNMLSGSRVTTIDVFSKETFNTQDAATCE